MKRKFAGFIAVLLTCCMVMQSMFVYANVDGSSSTSLFNVEEATEASETEVS